MKPNCYLAWFLRIDLSSRIQSFFYDTPTPHFIFFGLFAFLVGCTKPPTIDPAFMPYLERFKTDANRFHAKADATKVSVVFGLVEKATCANCQGRTITVWNECWKNDDDVERQILIYHELGHCVLGKGHSKQGDIMYPSRISEWIFQAQPDYFLKRYFSN